MYHFHLVDKLREVFIGKTHEELEKQKAFVRISSICNITAFSLERVSILGNCCSIDDW